MRPGARSSGPRTVERYRRLACSKDDETVQAGARTGSCRHRCRPHGIAGSSRPVHPRPGPVRAGMAPTPTRCPRSRLSRPNRGSRDRPLPCRNRRTALRPLLRCPLPRRRRAFAATRHVPKCSLVTPSVKGTISLDRDRARYEAEPFAPGPRRTQRPKIGGSPSTMIGPQMTWVRTGASTPPVARRCSPQTAPRIRPAKASMGLPVANVAAA